LKGVKKEDKKDRIGFDQSILYMSDDRWGLRRKHEKRKAIKRGIIFSIKK